MKLIDLLDVVEIGYEDEEAISVYKKTDGLFTKVVEIRENRIDFPEGSPGKHLNANVIFIFRDRNERKKSVAMILESDDE